MMTQVLQFQPPGRVDPNKGKPSSKQRAIEFLSELKNLSPKMQDDPVTLRKAFGCSKATFYRWMGELTALGLLPKPDRRVPLSSSLVPNAAVPSLVSSPKPLGARLAKPEPKKTGHKTSTAPSLVPTSVGDKTTQPPVEVGTRLEVDGSGPQKKKNQKENAPAREKPQPTETAGLEPKVELSTGPATPLEVSMAARGDKLEAADRSKLRWCKGRAGWNHFWEAYRNGTNLCLRKQYKAMWADATRQSTTAFEAIESGKTYQRVWEKSAEAVIKTGLCVADFLHRANDSRPRNLKIVPLKWLPSDATVEKVIAWASPEERAKTDRERDERKAFDGMTLLEIQERTKLAGV